MSRAIILLSSLLTVAWLATIAWWASTTPLSESMTCDGIHLVCAFREMPLNAMGDFTAGSFSVLAFLWLVTAVMLQGIELKRQHQEMVSSNQRLLEQAEYLKMHNAILVKAEKRLEIEAMVASICRDLISLLPKKFITRGASGDTVVSMKKAVSILSAQDIGSFVRFSDEIYTTLVKSTLSGLLVFHQEPSDENRAVLHAIRLRLRELDSICGEHAEERSRQVLVASNLLASALQLLAKSPTQTDTPPETSAS